MFDFGRELKRLFGASAPKDGLTGGDAALLELLELDLLRVEARAADVAAGRVSARDPAQRRLEAAMVWHELARRTGDPVALRKAAAAAEAAANGFGRRARPKAWARARCAQAITGLTGAGLIGDEGLNAAANFALTEAAATASDDLITAIAGSGQALIEARAVMAAGDRALVLAAAARFDGPIRTLEGFGRRRAAARLHAASARADRAELWLAAGVRLHDPLLLRMAIESAAAAQARLDIAYEPLSWARAAVLHAQARAALAEFDGDISAIAQVVDSLAVVLGHISRDHSPLDWTMAQIALGEVLQTLGEAAECDNAFDRAVGCYERALTVIGRNPALAQRAAVAHQRAVCLVRRAELRGDLAGLDAAETAFRAELSACKPAKDPVAWAVLQLNFARLYEARAHITGWRGRDRNAAGQALAAALDVFAEQGLRTLTDAAAKGLERLRMVPDATETAARDRGWHKGGPWAARASRASDRLLERVPPLVHPRA